MNPLVIKRDDVHNVNIIAQMYRADEQADEEIAKDFSEIIDKIIIDIYLKENIFLKDKTFIGVSQKEKIEFVKTKRQEILKKMQDSPFLQEDYINSEETSFKMTSCVKCSCLDEHEEEYHAWMKKHPDGVYCDVCGHKTDDFYKLL